MINLETLDNDVFDALKERGHSVDDIKQMTWDQAFDEYCEWHGLMRWGSTLRRVMANCKNSQG